MTITQRALFKTAIFVAGTIGLGVLGSLAYLYFPSLAPWVMILALYGFFVYLYYGIVRRQLEFQAQRVEQTLRG